MRALDPRLSQGAACLAALGLVMASWRWGFLAAGHAFLRDVHRLGHVTQQIAAYEQIAQQDHGVEAWVTRHRERLDRLTARFPHQEQLPQVLNALVDTLKASNLKLLDVDQGHLEPVLEGNAPFLIDRLSTYQLPVTVKAEGRYAALLDALDRLTQDTFPGVMSLERAQLQLTDPQGATLSMVLDLHLYVTGAAVPTTPQP